MFRALDFFQILLRNSLILKWIKSFFPSSNDTQYPIITKQKQVYRSFCKCINNTKLKYHIYISIQTLHSVLWQRFSLESLGYDATSFSHSSLQILCQVGWGASLHSYFQVSPEMFDRVQVRALAGPLPEHSGADFHQGSCITLLHSSFPQSWLVSQSLPLKNIPTAWCCHYHASL